MPISSQFRALEIPFNQQEAVTDSNAYQQYGKALLDIFLGLIVGLVFFFLLPFVSLMILATSGRPIFFKQQRVGKNGRVFTMIKFRTMRNGVPTIGADRFTRKNDARVIPGGRFMRKARIDELPQIINIIEGKMSVIGPRPERPEIVKELEDVIPGYQQRHAVKPGITGWSQVCNGYSDDMGGHCKKFEYDSYYIRQCSFWLDAIITYKTFAVIFRAMGK